MKNSIEEPNKNLSENIISSDNTEIVPEEKYNVSEKEISPLLWRIPNIRYTLIDAVKSSIKRNGVTRKIPLNSRGEVIGNLLHFIAGKEMNILKEEDFVIVDVPEEKLPEHVILDIFLNLQYDKTRLSLIAAEFYHELTEINRQTRALSLRIGKNTRKEVAALIGISEGYLGQAIKLKRDNPQVFRFLMNSEYTFRDLIKITDIQEYNSNMFKRLLKQEITLQNAWYGLDKKTKKRIETKKIKVPEENTMTYYLDDILADKEYEKELERKHQQNLNEDVKTENITLENKNTPTDEDEDSDIYDVIAASIEEEKTYRFMNKIIDDEGNRTTIQNILTKIDEKFYPDEDDEWYDVPDYELQPLNKYKQFRHISDKMLMEMYYGKKSTDEVPVTTTEPVATDNNLEKVVIGEDFLETKEIVTNTEPSQVSFLYSSSNPIFNSIDAIFADSENWFYKDVLEEKFANPFENIEQEVWDKQTENLHELVENGKIHQHKKVRRNIGNILLKFENKEPNVITTKHLSLLLDLLDSSVRISSAGYGVAKKLAEHIKDLTFEERAELELVGKKIIDIENTIQDCVFYQ